MSISITQGHLIDPANGIDEITDIFITQGQVSGVGTAPEGFVATTHIDASGKIVMPGIVDLCARLGEPGFEKKADIASESKAAIASGITSLCIPPDTSPVIDSPADVKFINRREQALKLCRLHVIAALTSELGGMHLSEMASLKEAGCVAVSNAMLSLKDGNVLRRALEYATSLGIPVIFTPEDEHIANHGCAHEGPVSTRLGLPGIPEAAETAAIGFILPLIEQTGAKVHFSHISTATGMNMIRRARHDGLRVSADACAHQLFLTEMDIADFNPLCHTRPPLRSLRDRDALRTGLRKNGLQAICSDHRPHENDAKLAPFAVTEPGISSLETLLPLSLRLVEEKIISLGEMVSLLSYQPAQLLGLPFGQLGVGAPADLCVVGTEDAWEMDVQKMLSRGKNSPFDGWMFQGKVTHTVIRGELVYAWEASH
ncbi:MAG: dihydroorotase [bacterium]